MDNNTCACEYQMVHVFCFAKPSRAQLTCSFSDVCTWKTWKLISHLKALPSTLDEICIFWTFSKRLSQYLEDKTERWTHLQYPRVLRARAFSNGTLTLISPRSKFWLFNYLIQWILKLYFVTKIIFFINVF